ncbi:hypothetical protein VCRA2133E348_210059 [Vibrio crassostreae]|nr:hypothetical protein VCRA2119O48_200061 [Vibrio crassostreae]CAK2770616.1 hypothetical protein VCRA2133E348_210059 [Vibrio crassostreae]CAK3221608.1 hypothetical protein VCRA213O314_190040 [Vibrio crassostreae]CAK3839282.1 hypothetical protein VCRA212O16_210062 [Vibrio crassostreae]
MHYHVFNGDAGGIIALLQLRLATLKESQLITGIKRDIQLLKQVAAKSDATSITVLDISMEKNISSLEQLLSQGVDVFFYCDHHRSGDVPESKHLEAVINLDAEVCTSLLINDKLNGRYTNWAIAAAFGDNLFAVAEKLVTSTNLTAGEIAFLKELCTLINYNGYGNDSDDLHIAPPGALYPVVGVP